MTNFLYNCSSICNIQKYSSLSNHDCSIITPIWTIPFTNLLLYYFRAKINISSGSTIKLQQKTFPREISTNPNPFGYIMGKKAIRIAGHPMARNYPACIQAYRHTGRADFLGRVDSIIFAREGLRRGEQCNIYNSHLYSLEPRRREKFLPSSSWRWEQRLFTVARAVSNARSRNVIREAASWCRKKFFAEASSVNALPAWCEVLRGSTVENWNCLLNGKKWRGSIR